MRLDGINGRTVRMILGLAVAFMLTAGGCGDEQTAVQEARQRAEQQVTPQPKRKAPAPEAATTGVTEASQPISHEVVVQRFRPARDPFKGVQETRRQAGPDEITHPLQQYSVQQIQLLGIIWGIETPAALVAAPDGKEYIIKAGTPVGTGDGRVVAILQDRVVIVERYYDYRGQLQKERYELKLPKEGE